MKKAKIFLAILVIMISSCLQQKDFDYPVIHTGEVTDIDESGATFHAKITASGAQGITEYGFVWALSENPDLSKSRISISDKPENGVFSSRISIDLLPGQIYFVKAYASDGNFTVFGRQVRFLSLGSMHPEITGFTPSEGEGGTQVTITGKNFSSDPEGNTVIFGRRQAFIEQASTEQLVVRLPDNMNISGNVRIEVTTDGGKAVSGSTFLLHGCLIESFEPASLMIGDTMYIHATGNGSNPGENLVKIGNTTAEILSVEEGLIKIVVPYSATLGSKELSLAAFGKTCYSPDSVTYNSPWDKITGMNNFFRSGEAVFVCDSKAYIGFGASVTQGSPGTYKDLWSFDHTSGVLAKCADFPSYARELPAAFSIGNKGYLGLGYYNSGSSGTEFYTDFFEYDPASDSWTRKADFPNQTQRVTVSFTIGKKGYAMSGFEFFEIWVYDQENDLWNRLNDFSSYAAVEPHGVEYDGKAYVFGQNRGGLWEYSPADDSWKILADFPGEERAGAVNFSLGGFLYRGSGYSPADSFRYFTDFWRYDIRNDKWTRITDLPFAGRAGAIGYSLGGKAFICSGYNILSGAGINSESFIVFDPE